MNFKRCAVRNDLKTTIIKTLSKGLDIETLSVLIDTEIEGVGFLDDVTNEIEKEIEKEHGGKIRYDGQSLETVFKIVGSIVDEDVVKKAASDVIMNHIRTGNASLKQGSSMKWVNVRGEVEAEFQKYSIYQMQDELENITLEAFIYSVIEESEPTIAARKAFTKACEATGLTEEEYAGWYKEVD